MRKKPNPFSFHFLALGPKCTKTLILPREVVLKQSPPLRAQGVRGRPVASEVIASTLQIILEEKKRKQFDLDSVLQSIL